MLLTRSKSSLSSMVSAFSIATLNLAGYDPVNVPYFTEGMYRWLREGDARDGTWDRKTDYMSMTIPNKSTSKQSPTKVEYSKCVSEREHLTTLALKQYKVLIEKVAQLRGQFKQQSGAKVTAVDVEKVGRQIHERAQERREKAADDGDSDFLLRPQALWSSKKRKLGPPFRDGERVPKHAPKKTSNGPAPYGVLVSENENTLLTQPIVDDEGHDDDRRWRPAH